MAPEVERALEIVLGKARGGTQADGAKEVMLLVEGKRLSKDVW